MARSIRVLGALAAFALEIAEAKAGLEDLSPPPSGNWSELKSTSAEKATEQIDRSNTPGCLRDLSCKLLKQILAPFIHGTLTVSDVRPFIMSSLEPS